MPTGRGELANGRERLLSARRGGTPGIELRSVIRTGRHSVASNRLVTNPSSLKMVLTAPISHPERRAAVVAAAAQAADPGAPAAMPSLARVSSANRPAPVEPGVHRLHRGWARAAREGRRIAVLPSGGGMRCLACLLRVAARRSCPVLLVCGAALRRIDSCGEARPGICGPPQRSVSIGAGAARRIG